MTRGKCSTTADMTRKDFCNRLLAFCGCLFAVDSLGGQSFEPFNGQADELLYFLRQIPDVRNSFVCLAGKISQDLLLNCFDALGKSNVRYLLKNHRLCLLKQSSETFEHVFRYSGIQQCDRLCVISTDAIESAHVENMLSVVYDFPGRETLSDVTLQRLLKASRSSIVVTGVHRIVDCAFLPVESRTWHGKIMTIGDRAIIITGIGELKNEIG